MQKQQKKFPVAQVMISVASLGFFAYFFLGTGFFQEQEEIVEQDIPKYQSLHAPVHRKDENQKTYQPIPNFAQKNIMSVGDVRESLHNVALMQISRSAPLNLSQNYYEWIAGLRPQEGHALIHYLKRMPVEGWEKKLSELQRLPTIELKRHLYQRSREGQCLNGDCFD